MSAPAGFYPDPEHPGLQRRWNGESWTDERQPSPPQVPLTPARRRRGFPIFAGVVLGLCALWAVFGMANVFAGDSGPAEVSSQYIGAQRAYLETVRSAAVAGGGGWNADVERASLSVGADACEGWWMLTGSADDRLSVLRVAAAGSSDDEKAMFDTAVLAAVAHLCPR